MGSIVPQQKVAATNRIVFRARNDDSGCRQSSQSPLKTAIVMNGIKMEQPPSRGRSEAPPGIAAARDVRHDHAPERLAPYGVTGTGEMLRAIFFATSSGILGRTTTWQLQVPFFAGTLELKPLVSFGWRDALS
jgi:hypothetical protein